MMEMVKDTACYWWYNNTKHIDKFKLYIRQCYLVVWSVEKIQKVKIQNLSGKKTGRIMLLSKCAGCDSKKSKFVKKQEASGLLSSLGIKTSLDKFLY